MTCRSGPGPLLPHPLGMLVEWRGLLYVRRVCSRFRTSLRLPTRIALLLDELPPLSPNHEPGMRRPPSPLVATLLLLQLGAHRVPGRTFPPSPPPSALPVAAAGGASRPPIGRNSDAGAQSAPASPLYNNTAILTAPSLSTQRPGGTTYAQASSAARSVRPPPSHRYAPFAERDFFVDLRAANPYYTVDDRDDFILDDLRVDINDLLALWVDSISRLVRVTVRTPEIAATTIDRLRAGVRWTACGGAMVYGWHPSRAAVAVRLSDVPLGADLDLIAEHMCLFGRVLSVQRARERAQGRIGARGLTTGVVHLSMELRPSTPLPNFVEVESHAGDFIAIFPVFSDVLRRRCFRCGDTGHVGQFCRARERAKTAPPHTWSVLRVPPEDGPAGGAVHRPPPPPPVMATGTVEMRNRPGSSSMLVDSPQAPCVPPGVGPAGGAVPGRPPPPLAVGSVHPFRRSGSSSSLDDGPLPPWVPPGVGPAGGAAAERPPPPSVAGTAVKLLSGSSSLTPLVPRVPPGDGPAGGVVSGQPPPRPAVGSGTSKSHTGPSPLPGDLPVAPRVPPGDGPAGGAVSERQPPPSAAGAAASSPSALLLHLSPSPSLAEPAIPSCGPSTVPSAASSSPSYSPPESIPDEPPPLIIRDRSPRDRSLSSSSEMSASDAAEGFQTASTRKRSRRKGRAGEEKAARFQLVETPPSLHISDSSQDGSTA